MSFAQPDVTCTTLYRSRIMPKAVTTASFGGFDKTAMQFWHELAIEMNREWFTANKARYETLWVQPMTALLGDVTARLAKAYKPLQLGEPKVMRIHRDVRFAKDKTPYKTHIGAVITVEGKKVGEGVYPRGRIYAYVMPR